MAISRIKHAMVWVLLVSLTVASLAMAEGASVPTQRADILASAVDSQGKILWSLQVSTNLVPVTANAGGGIFGGSSTSSEPSKAPPADHLCLLKPVEVSQTIEATGPATTRPTKWLGRRELNVSEMMVSDNRARVALSFCEKMPYGLPEQPEYSVSGVTTVINIENGKEICIGGTNDLRYLLKITLGK